MKETLRQILERWPRAYVELLRLKRRNHWSRGWVVSRDTEVVIEGYPRSGNSFAKSALVAVQPQRPNFATHLHSPAQIIQAAKWGIPTMVLLREPRGAVIGNLAFGCELYKKDPEAMPSSDFVRALARWVFFYQRILPWQGAFFVARFDRVIADFGQVTEAFNQQCGKNFVLFEHTPEKVDAIMGKSTHIGPQAYREKIKKVLQERYEAATPAAMRKEADDLYRCLGNGG